MLDSDQESDLKTTINAGRSAKQMTDKDILSSDFNDISEILNNNGYGGWCKAIRKAVELLKQQEAVRPQDAEMLIIHNGGAEEYVKDIESIVLLAHKDYDIVYCGRFSEGR